MILIYGVAVMIVWACIGSRRRLKLLGVFFAAAVLLVLDRSCDPNAFFRRPPMTEKQFSAKFLEPYIDVSGITFQHYYEGSVGGSILIATIQAPPEKTDQIIAGLKAVQDRAQPTKKGAYIGQKVSYLYPTKTLPPWMKLDWEADYDCWSVSVTDTTYEIFRLPGAEEVILVAVQT